MADLYGNEHVAQIVTFSTIKARAAVRDAARVLGHPYIVGDRIAKMMPPLVRLALPRLMVARMMWLLASLPAAKPLIRLARLRRRADQAQ